MNRIFRVIQEHQLINFSHHSVTIETIPGSCRDTKSAGNATQLSQTAQTEKEFVFVFSEIAMGQAEQH